MSGKRRFRLAIFVVLLSCTFAAGNSLAQTAPTSHAQLELITEQSTYEPGHAIWAGVLFHLDPGWHVYWQNPGDSGTPPVIHWALPAGFRAGALRWPAPERLGSGSIIDYGYTGDVLLMAPIAAPASAKNTATIRADVNYVVCRQICIPGKAQLTKSVPADNGHSAGPGDSGKVFATTRERLPERAPASWRTSASARKDRFELRVRGVAAKPGVLFLPLEADIIDNAAPQTISATNGGFNLSLKTSDLLSNMPRVLKGVLTIPGLGAYQISALVTQ
jgi:DsbC/DsbD-like thiol-disulfide interchange protein